MLSHLKQLEDGNHIHILTWNFMKYGFCYWAIENYRVYFFTPILKGFIKVGLIAGGNMLTVPQFCDPSRIIKLGTDLAVPYTNTLINLNLMDASVAQQMSIASTQLGIELSFIIIAVQVFIILLEFYIMATLAIILLPFGVNSHTRFIAEKVWPAIVACGVKLMVLAFILSIALGKLFDGKVALATELAKAHANITSAQSMESLGTSLALAFLCWQAPSMAAALLSGTSSSSLGAAQGATTSMNAAGTAAGKAGGSVGGRIAGIMDDLNKRTGGALKSAAGGGDQRH